MRLRHPPRSSYFVMPAISLTLLCGTVFGEQALHRITHDQIHSFETHQAKKRPAYLTNLPWFNALQISVPDNLKGAFLEELARMTKVNGWSADVLLLPDKEEIHLLSAIAVDKEAIVNGKIPPAVRLNLRPPTYGEEKQHIQRANLPFSVREELQKAYWGAGSADPEALRKKLNEVFDAASAATAADDARILYEQGIEEEKNNHRSEAQEAYEAALQIHPTYADAHIRLGLLLRDNFNDKAAEQHYRAAIAAAPSNAMAYYNLGILLAGQNRYEEAVGAYNGALRLEPGHAEAHYYIASLYDQWGKYALARKHYLRYAELAAGQPDPRLADAIKRAKELSDFNRIVTDEPKLTEGASPDPHLHPVLFLSHGSIRSSGAGAVAVPTPRVEEEPTRNTQEAAALYELGRSLEQDPATREQAADAYEKALDLDPDHAGAHNNLGNIFYDAGKFSEAKRHYRAAIGIDPSLMIAHFNLGNALDAEDLYALAIGAYNAALRLEPTYADAHYNIALTYEKLGEYAKAFEHWLAYTLHAEDQSDDSYKKALKRVEDGRQFGMRTGTQ